MKRWFDNSNLKSEMDSVENCEEHSIRWFCKNEIDSAFIFEDDHCMQSFASMLKMQLEEDKGVIKIGMADIMPFASNCEHIRIIRCADKATLGKIIKKRPVYCIINVMGASLSKRDIDAAYPYVHFKSGNIILSAILDNDTEKTQTEYFLL